MKEEKYPLAGMGAPTAIKTPKRDWWGPIGRTTPEHMWIPDPQLKPDVPIQHMWWAGYHATTLLPDVVVMGNDHFDFPTLNYWTRMEAGFTSQDVIADLCAAHHGLDMFLDGFVAGCNERPEVPDDYDPLFVFLEGNHDWRAERAFHEDRRFARLFPMPQTITRRVFAARDMTIRWVPWKKTICIDQVNYAHAAINPASSKPMGGKAQSKLTRLKDTYVIGHHVGKDLAEDFTPSGRKIRFVQAGSFYLHDEEYSPCTNYWRGLIYMHDVKDGYFNLMEIDMEYLWKRYQKRTGWIYADPTWNEDLYDANKEDEDE
jgi:hypothetical protein